MSNANQTSANVLISRTVVMTLSLFIGTFELAADDPVEPAAVPASKHADDATQRSDPAPNQSQKLAQYLTNCDFVGRYTNDAKAGKPPKEERYTIQSCRALEQPEMYELKVRIQYGSVDSEVPLQVRIVFADQTPVITLDQMWIPGMGTFDARVMIRRDRYAGTWQHDNHGGHLFGVIEQRDETEQRDE